jgi:hypothetical protein
MPRRLVEPKQTKERSSIMRLRHILVVLSAALVSASFADYTARLYFENVTTGQNGPGQIEANPGDQICIKYDFSGAGGPYDKWFTLQMTFCLDNQCCLPCDPWGNSWEDQIRDAIEPLGNFIIVQQYHQCSDGPMYDWAVDPTDSTKPFVCDPGLSVLLQGISSSQYAAGISITLFRWVVGDCRPEGCYVDWMFDGRETNTGLSTRIIDIMDTTVDVTDNWVHCVPEPGSIAATGVGLIGLLALRRRK